MRPALSSSQNLVSAISHTQATLEAYEQHAKQYILQTPVVELNAEGDLAKWILKSLETTSQEDVILEIGSATPRDAIFMRSQGFQVQCTDATIAFLDDLAKRGEPAYHLNILDDILEKNQYSMMFANAVFQHFTPQQTHYALSKMFNALPKKGSVALSLKQGTGERWITEKFPSRRFVHYWQPGSIVSLFELIGFEVVYLAYDVRGEFNDHKWIMLTAIKN